MKTRNASLLLLSCGGTIGMRQNLRTSTLAPALSAAELMESEPRLGELFHIETRGITAIDSTNMQPAHWMRIAEQIASSYGDFDGFVITHGTDTMAYTASALSFVLKGTGKPVVLTGAQVPPEILGSDALPNLINACKVATMDLAEVCIVFGTRILRGNRATKLSESERNAFTSPVFPPLGFIRLQPELTYAGVRRRQNRDMAVAGGFTGNIAVLRCVPGMDPELISHLQRGGIDGLILESFGTGNLPSEEQSLLPAVRALTAAGIPVVITTQCIYGTTRMHRYEVGKAALAAGAIPAGDMTTEAAFTKLKWCLHATRELEGIRALYQDDLAGELSIGAMDQA